MLVRCLCKPQLMLIIRYYVAILPYLHALPTIRQRVIKLIFDRHFLQIVSSKLLLLSKLVQYIMHMQCNAMHALAIITPITRY